MSDVGQKGKAVPGGRAPERAPGFFESGIFRDPVVRYMTYAAAGLVILFLVTVVGALATGVMSPTGPRTARERELQSAAATVKAGARGEAWTPYIDALVATGDLTQARVALSQARASVSGTMPVSNIDLSEARLLSAEGRYADAAQMADRAMKGYQAEYDAKVAALAGQKTTADNAPMRRPGYYDAALAKAYADVALKRYSDAVTAFDVYLKVNPTASDIFIDRGYAKVELNDKAGAEKDFRAALKYVPYDAEAKAGLKKIGVAQ
jgi:tetratricopeptide (TPR) repeat protein